jgi:hypothetical protein
MRLRERWSDVAFALLAAGILAWVAWDAFSVRLITFFPGADYWEHTAVLRALIENPWHPRHPAVVTDAGSPRFGPHFLLVALLARLLHFGAIDAMALASVLNTALFLLGIFLFYRTYFRDRLASLYGLVVSFGSWLLAPHFSNVYKLSVFFSDAGYPSTAALAVTFLELALVTRLLRAERAPKPLLALSAFGCAYLYITHPLTAMMGFAAVLLLAATEPGVPLRRRLWVGGTLPLGLLLACFWPYYPALGMVVGGTAARVEHGLHTEGVTELHKFYSPNELFQILGFSLLAVPCFGYMVVLRRHLFVVLGALAMFAVFVAGAFFTVPLVHRFVLLAVFFLQVGVVFLLLSLTPHGPVLPRWAERRGLRGAAALATAVFLGYLVVSNVRTAAERFEDVRRGPSATVRAGRRIGELAGTDGVVLADPLPSWSIPTFGPRIVALHHTNPLIRDSDERKQAVKRFFSPGTSDAERSEILTRYGVTHVLFTSRDASGPALHFTARVGTPSRLPTGMTLYTLTPSARQR